MPILIYETLPEKRIRKEAKETIEQVEKWFEDNPKRRVCRAELWYGKVIHIKRKTIAEQINKAADEAING